MKIILKNNSDIRKAKKKAKKVKIAKKVNNEIAKLADTRPFADLKGIDKKLRLPRGTSFEMGGYADYFAFVDEDV